MARECVFMLVLGARVCDFTAVCLLGDLLVSAVWHPHAVTPGAAVGMRGDYFFVVERDRASPQGGGTQAQGRNLFRRDMPAESLREQVCL